MKQPSMVLIIGIRKCLKTLLRLEEKLQCKINSVMDVDRKNDLIIMLKNVIILRAHAQKDL